MIVRHKKQINDKLVLERSRQMTPEGYLKATAAITKVGVQKYRASEFGFGPDDVIIGVFRPPGTVFHPETIESTKLKPITHQHPEEDVNAKNHNRYDVGTVGETVEPIDSEILGANILLTDSVIVQDVNERKIEELSLGYDSYIVSENGEYNGEKYQYRFDGPMIVNHLAIVDAARCGDSVKILDKGEKNMFKKSMAVKLLKDAKASESIIKGFMKDKDENADVDMAEFNTAMAQAIKANDLDLGAVVPLLVKEMMPAMEALIKEDDFKATLAKELAAAMSTSADPEPEPPMDQDPTETIETEETTEDQEETEAEKKQTDACKKDSAIQDAANKRANLIILGKPYFDENQDVNSMKDRDIIIHVAEKIGVKDAKSKSDDYLLGIIDSVNQDRSDASQQLYGNKFNDSSNNQSCTRPISGLGARNLPK
jgi:hypothetical protein